MALQFEFEESVGLENARLALSLAEDVFRQGGEEWQVRFFRVDRGSFGVRVRRGEAKRVWLFDSGRGLEPGVRAAFSSAVTSLALGA